MDDYNRIVADRITALCEKHGITVAELASMCNMNRATIEHILDGTCKKPRIQTLYKISAAFHMTVREFLDPQEPDPEPEPEPEETC